MRMFTLLVSAAVLAGCEPRQPQVSVEDRAMAACQRMGLPLGSAPYADCVTRMFQTYMQAQSMDQASRRAAAASMYRAPPQTIQVQQAPPSIFGNVTPVQSPWGPR